MVIAEEAALLASLAGRICCATPQQNAFPLSIAMKVYDLHDKEERVFDFGLRTLCWCVAAYVEL